MDEDRFLFLEALSLSEKKFFLSYVNICPYDGKTAIASPIIEEFFEYIDNAYEIEDDTFSNFITHTHPSLSFDKKYFSCESNEFYSYSKLNFLGAKKYYKNFKNEEEKGFLKDFLIKKPESINIKNNILTNVIDIKNLSLLAANPLKFYFTKILKMYLKKEDENEDFLKKDFTLSFLDKFHIRNESHKRDQNQIILKKEREGNMPVGIMKAVAKEEINKHVSDYLNNFEKLQISLKDIQSVEMSLSCSKAKKISDHRWEVPAIEVNIDNEVFFKLVGVLKGITPQGMIVYSDMKLRDIIKIWPEYLIFLKLNPLFLNVKPALLFTKIGKEKLLTELDVNKALEKYLRYYAVCLSSFSPLLRDWAEPLLLKDQMALEKAIFKSFSEKPIFEDMYFNFAFSRFEKPPSSTKIYENWSPFLKQTFEPLLKEWSFI